MEEKNNLISLFTLAFLLVLLIAGFIRYQYIFTESVWVDETVYMWQGYRVLHSPSLLLTPDYYGNTPFPLLVIAFFNLFSDDRFIAGRLAAYFFSLLGIALAYFIGKELKDGYTGLLAALLVAFNPLHWFLGSRTLMDLPEATMVSLCMYMLLRFERERTQRNFSFLALAVLVTIGTKLPGFLVLPGIVFYYLLRGITAPTRVMAFFSLLRDKRIAASALFVGGVFSFFIITKLRFITGLLDSIEPRWAFFDTFPFMFTKTIIVFLCLGTFLTLYYRKWDAIAILCFFFSFLIAFSIFPAEPDPRHIAPIIPLGIIIATFAYFELGTFIKPFLAFPFFEWGLLIIGMFFLFPLFTLGNALNQDKSYVFTGYNEAGKWLADNLPEGVLAYVSSQGPMRLFSGLGYRDEGGPLRQIQTFGEGDVPDFSKEKLPILLHIDVWERGPLWSSPPTDQKIKNLINQGFKIVKIVHRKYPTKEGLQDGPVHLFLMKAQ